MEATNSFATQLSATPSPLRKAANVSDKTQYIEMLFLVDATGSMSSWIAQCKEVVNKIIDSVDQQLNKAGSRKINQFRVAFVAYRDISDAQRFEVFPFSMDTAAFKEFVSNLKADGGGDACEDV